MTTRTLVTTAEAAAVMKLSPSYFPNWARRRDLKPAKHVRLGRSTVALWDMDEVFEAEQRDPKSWRRLKGSGS